MKRITFVILGIAVILLFSFSTQSLIEEKEIKTAEISKKKAPALEPVNFSY